VSTSDEVGRTVRTAMRGWHQTLRLCLIMLVAAIAVAAFFAVEGYAATRALPATSRPGYVSSGNGRP